MTIEKESLNPGQGVVVPVEVAPAGLNERDFLVGEMVDRFLKEVGIRNEVGVENENELTLGFRHAIFKSARFEARAVGAMKTLGVKTLFAKACCSGPGNFHRFIG